MGRGAATAIRSSRGVLGGPGPAGRHGGTADPAGLTIELAAAVALADLDRVVAAATDVALLAPLAESVDAAMYWQGPDAEDEALTVPEVADALMPVALALGGAPAGRWWSSSMTPDQQQYVQHLAGLHDDDPHACRTHWPVSPAGDRTLLAEDSSGGPMPAAGRWRQGPGRGSMRSPVRRWLIPDFTAAAADYDAIHLSVVGYLTTAGRALPVGDARTMLAGWNPDETWWLADVLSSSGPAERWTTTKQDEPLGWNPASEHGS